MIVSDRAALISLINIGEFDLLYLFTEKILIPPEVYDEVSVVEEDRRFLDVLKGQGKLAVVESGDVSLWEALRICLDRGESAAIVLAVREGLPLLIDEKKGRQTAGRTFAISSGFFRGLKLTSTISPRL